jgi:hypothetical protein
MSGGTVRTCQRCGTKGTADNPLLFLKGDDLLTFEYNVWSPNLIICAKCFFKWLREEAGKTVDELVELRIAVTERERADRIADTLLTELREKGSVCLTKDVVFYTNGKRVFLKVTDYEKGYWAQVPLDEVTFRAALKFFERLAESKAERSTGRDGSGANNPAMPLSMRTREKAEEITPWLRAKNGLF